MHSAQKVLPLHQDFLFLDLNFSLDYNIEKIVLIHLSSSITSKKTTLVMHRKLRIKPEAAINTSRPNEYAIYESFSLEERHSPNEHGSKQNKTKQKTIEVNSIL